MSNDGFKRDKCGLCNGSGNIDGRDFYPTRVCYGCNGRGYTIIKIVECLGYFTIFATVLLF